MSRNTSLNTRPTSDSAGTSRSPRVAVLTRTMRSRSSRTCRPTDDWVNIARRIARSCLETAPAAARTSHTVEEPAGTTSPASSPRPRSRAGVVRPRPRPCPGGHPRNGRPRPPRPIRTAHRQAESTRSPAGVIDSHQHVAACHGTTHLRPTGTWTAGPLSRDRPSHDATHPPPIVGSARGPPPAEAARRRPDLVVRAPAGRRASARPGRHGGGEGRGSSVRQRTARRWTGRRPRRRPARPRRGQLGLDVVDGGGAEREADRQRRARTAVITARAALTGSPAWAWLVSSAQVLEAPELAV